jgi:hypothetical protein
MKGVSDHCSIGAKTGHRVILREVYYPTSLAERPVDLKQKSMRRRFFTLDVFTDQRFTGNPLAVVLDPNGFDSDAMQAIACP